MNTSTKEQIMNIAVILAGGVGSRFGDNVPKQFVEVLGKPVIAYTIEQFEKVYANEITNGLYNSIWDVVKVIGVTDKIMNDAVCFADRKTDSKMTLEFVAALQESFIELGQSEEGLECFDPFGYKGFKSGHNSDYDSTSSALALLQE